MTSLPAVAGNATLPAYLPTFNNAWHSCRRTHTCSHMQAWLILPCQTNSNHVRLPTSLWFKMYQNHWISWHSCCCQTYVGFNSLHVRLALLFCCFLFLFFFFFFSINDNVIKFYKPFHSSCAFAASRDQKELCSRTATKTTHQSDRQLHRYSQRLLERLFERLSELMANHWQQIGSRPASRQQQRATHSGSSAPT